MASGIAEMLLQSRDGEIFLLPALLAEWSEGSVSGLRAKGGAEVDMSWKEGRLETMKLQFTRDNAVVLHYRDITEELGDEASHWSTNTRTSL